jgi:hypothetical protein
MNRRDFLKLGAASSAALTATAFTATLTGCSESLPANSAWKVLRAKDRILLSAIAPVMLKGSLPSDPQAKQKNIEIMLQYIDTGISKLGPHNTKQLSDLFTLLNFGLSRGLTTGIWSSWDKASEDEIENFLNRWRESSVSLFNVAYNGLNKLMCATWFGQPAAWQNIGYPGPLYPDVLITKS